MGEDKKPVVFQAMQQFVVFPDRRCQVELQDAILRFTITGNEFDSQWLSRGMGQNFGEKAADWSKKLSAKAMMAYGAGIMVISFVLLCFVLYMSATATTPVKKKGLGIGVLAFGVIVGMVMMIAGFFTSGSSGEPFSLPLSHITKATLLPAQSELARRGEPQVARLQLQVKSGKPMTFGIPSDEDLETMKSVIPGVESE
jgi:hypothetical protein